VINFNFLLNYLKIVVDAYPEEENIDIHHVMSFVYIDNLMIKALNACLKMIK
jgi:hypothetical protein